MPTISELTALSALSKLDKFEVERAADSTSYSVTAQDIATFVKNISNGGFKGSTTKSIDDFTIEDIGMWWWVNGSSNPTGLTSGVVEIISFNGPDDDNVEATFLQRLSLMDKVYQRMWINGQWSNWGSLANKNGATIEYGTSTAERVDFPTGRFTSTPSVVAVPLNMSDSNNLYLNLINVKNVSNTGFNVLKWKSENGRSVETITTTTNPDTREVTTQTVTAQGAWTADSSLPFYWIAISDVGG